MSNIENCDAIAKKILEDIDSLLILLNNRYRNSPDANSRTY